MANGWFNVWNETRVQHPLEALLPDPVMVCIFVFNQLCSVCECEQNVTFRHMNCRAHSAPIKLSKLGPLSSNSIESRKYCTNDVPLSSCVTFGTTSLHPPNSSWPLIRAWVCAADQRRCRSSSLWPWHPPTPPPNSPSIPSIRRSSFASQHGRV